MCECNICQRGRNFQARLAQLPEEHRPYFEALYDSLEHTEMDRDYYHAVLDGSWPTADEVLAGFRARHAAKLAQTSTPDAPLDTAAAA